MKKLIAIFSFLLLSASLQAQHKINITEGSFLKSIDWYIKTTIDTFNASPFPQKIHSLGQLGRVVSIEFYKKIDSVEEKVVADSDIYIISHTRNRFKISFDTWSLDDRPPSFYFIKNGTGVVIYTGLEKYMLFEKVNITSMRKNLLATTVKKPIDFSPPALVYIVEYWIDINAVYQNGFKSTPIRPKYLR